MTSETRIEISLPDQRLTLFSTGAGPAQFPVSTAKNGPGERMDSYCTPRGAHVIAEKIGAGAAPGTVFVGRQTTGEIYAPALRAAHPGRDWILTRILWLAGIEPGRNQGGEVDSYRRYIYIHGAPADVPMGRPGSAGCIRMTNADVVWLFDRVEVGTPVLIRE
ncbi:MAG: L,D-transpeptidase [Gammaproteobacteria bacterium]|nr:L,D-transpeptidase [Gammaproteobacteria bacterium]